MKTVLAVDDHQAALDVYGEVLRGKYRVLAARGGGAGIDMFRKHRPDAVILDLLMPDLDGEKVATEMLRADPQARILVVTVVDECRRAAALMRSGARGYVVKPLSCERLLSALEEALESREGFQPVSTPFVARLSATLTEHLRSRRAALVFGPRGAGKETLARLAFRSLGLSAGSIWRLDPEGWRDPMSELAEEAHGAVGFLLRQEAARDVSAAFDAAWTFASSPERSENVYAVALVDVLRAELRTVRSLAAHLPPEVSFEVPPPSLRPEDVRVLLRHFAGEFGNAHFDLEVATPLALRAMSNHEKTDRIGFLRAVAAVQRGRDEAPLLRRLAQVTHKP